MTSLSLLASMTAGIYSIDNTCYVSGLSLMLQYSKTFLKRPLKKTKNCFSAFSIHLCEILHTKIGFQANLSFNADQKYCRMLQESILQYFRP